MKNSPMLINLEPFLAGFLPPPGSVLLEYDGVYFAKGDWRLSNPKIDSIMARLGGNSIFFGGSWTKFQKGRRLALFSLSPQLNRLVLFCIVTSSSEAPNPFCRAGTSSTGKSHCHCWFGDIKQFRPPFFSIAL